MKRLFSLSSDIIEFSRKYLEHLGLDIQDSRQRAASVLRLSDFFIENPTSHTPWGESWAVDAYLSYYLPLNEVRVRAVAEEGQALNFFDGLTQLVDFGAGPATASFALRRTIKNLKTFYLIDRSEVPASLISRSGPFEFSFKKKFPAWDPDQLARALFVASYSLTEGTLPPEALSFEAIMILEPSTQNDGRSLLKLREELIKKNYFIWAPCPHQKNCPLLHESPRDWCHDRVHLDRPSWLKEIEEYLPFRNETLTFSYLLARKTPPPPTSWARLVGDRLKEKGKDRQMICRGGQREFLAWLHRNGSSPELPRGARVAVPENSRLVSNEIRLTSMEATPSGSGIIQIR